MQARVWKPPRIRSAEKQQRPALTTRSRVALSVAHPPHTLLDLLSPLNTKHFSRSFFSLFSPSPLNPQCKKKNSSHPSFHRSLSTTANPKTLPSTSESAATAAMPDPSIDILRAHINSDTTLNTSKRVAILKSLKARLKACRKHIDDNDPAGLRSALSENKGKAFGSASSRWPCAVADALLSIHMSVAAKTQLRDLSTDTPRELLLRRRQRRAKAFYPIRREETDPSEAAMIKSEREYEVERTRRQQAEEKDPPFVLLDEAVDLSRNFAPLTMLPAKDGLLDPPSSASGSTSTAFPRPSSARSTASSTNLRTSSLYIQRSITPDATSSLSTRQIYDALQATGYTHISIPLARMLERCIEENDPGSFVYFFNNLSPSYQTDDVVSKFLFFDRLLVEGRILDATQYILKAPDRLFSGNAKNRITFDKCALSNNNLPRVRQVAASLMKLSEVPGERLQTLLLLGLHQRRVQNGLVVPNLDWPTSIFDLLHDRKSPMWRRTYRHLIREYARAGVVERVKIAWGRMNAEGIVPDEYDYVSLLMLFARTGAVKEIQYLFVTLKEKGFLTENFVRQIRPHEHVIRAFCKRGDLEGARQEVGRVRDTPEAILTPGMYHPLIDAAIRLGVSGLPDELFEEMGRDGIVPDRRTYRRILSATVAVDNMDAAASCFVMIQELFPGAPDPGEYLSLADGYVRAGDVRAALDTLRKMRDACGYDPSRNAELPCSATDFAHPAAFADHHLRVSLMTRFGRTGDLSAVKRIYQTIVEDGHEVDKFTVHVLINAYVVAGHVSEAARLLETTFADHFASDAAPFYTIFMKQFARKGAHDACLKTYETMLERGVRPDARCYQALIGSYCRHGDMISADRFLEEMKREVASGKIARGKREEITYSVMIAGWAKQDGLKRVAEILEEMKDRGAHVTYFAKRHLGALRERHAAGILGNRKPRAAKRRGDTENAASGDLAPVTSEANRDRSSKSSDGGSADDDRDPIGSSDDDGVSASTEVESVVEGSKVAKIEDEELESWMKDAP